MFGIRNLREPREASQPNQLDMVGERGFEPPTPWSRIRWPQEVRVTPRVLRQHGGPLFMQLSRISLASQVCPNDTEQTHARRAGMHGLRHKERHTTCLSEPMCLELPFRQSSAGVNPPDLLFPHLNGKPRTTLRVAWSQICKAAGL